MRTRVYYDDSAIMGLMDADHPQREELRKQFRHLIARPDGSVIDTWSETRLLHEHLLNTDNVADSVAEDF